MLRTFLAPEVRQRFDLPHRRARLDRHGGDRHAFEECLDRPGCHQRRRRIHQDDVAERPVLPRSTARAISQLRSALPPVSSPGDACRTAKSAGSSVRLSTAPSRLSKASVGPVVVISSSPSDRWSPKIVAFSYTPIAFPDTVLNSLTLSHFHRKLCISPR